MRHGRLTPVHFGYFSLAQLQKMSLSACGRELDLEGVSAVGIPQSQIMELLFDAQFASTDKEAVFRRFSDQLLPLLEK